MPATASPPTSHWLVACLCAAWCRTCDEYRTVMAEVARAHPAMRFAWVDIEDHADALDDPDGAAQDIENFPTLLIVHGQTPHFFGTVLPHAGVLDRLVAQAEAGLLPHLAEPTARRLAGAVARLCQDAPRAVRLD
ncbi:thioredoxin family protein [Ideonella sp.]|uniref:thioredoxin family protein n=1 Tax=Ideonella sp. TaxID=1929293 RepID=UPI002B46371D|nr:thioredoxin family protein [Ideonella sp.]HJV68196.1 thioredoxin family protein [Ideonella sp.]